MAYFRTLFPSSVREIVGVYHVVAAFCVGSAPAWRTTAPDDWFLPDDSVLFDFRLSNDVPKVSVSPVANHGLFRKFLFLRWVDLEVVPGFVEDLLEVRQIPVACNNQWCSIFIHLLLVGQ